MSRFGSRNLSLRGILSGLNLSRSWWILILFLLTFHILAIGFEIFYSNELSVFLRIRHSGVGATGRVMSVRVVEDPEGPDSYYVEYSFNHDIQEY
jgi:hypothetical protein